jgi:hypothetical protein
LPITGTPFLVGVEPQPLNNVSLIAQQQPRISVDCHNLGQQVRVIGHGFGRKKISAKMVQLAKSQLVE